MVRIEQRIPSVSEYMALRSAVGWRVPTVEDCDRALLGTRLAVCAVDGDETIGMGRLVSDGALYWFIVDVIINPERQGHGIGSSVLRELETLAAQESATGNVNLVAGRDVIAFYEHLGYQATDSSFMVKRLR
jgi:GNAT superfamily N-acetyltransferase